MKLKNGYTPKSAAHDIAMGWLSAAHTGKSGDIADYASTPGEVRALKNAIVRLHNRLLSDSGLDGQQLSLVYPH